MVIDLSKKKHKYRAKSIVFDKKLYPSKLQASCAARLKLLLKMGKIISLREEVRYNIDINGKNIGSYYLDFQYFSVEDNKMIYEDTKGYNTPLSKFKIKIVEALYGIKIDLIFK